jgi:hypothetical protein
MTHKTPGFAAKGLLAMADAARTPLVRRARGVLALTAVAAVLAVPTTASALDPKLVPSIGADTGRFTLPIKCGIKLGGLKIISLNGTVDIEGIAPVQLGPGQEFYLTQGKGALTLPGFLSLLGPIVTVTKADANITSLRIGATRSTPATVDLAKNYDLSVADVPVQFGKIITVGLPKEGNFLVGPYHAPADGRVQFRFEGADADVTLKSTLGLKIKVTAECVASEGNALLSVAVGSNVDASKPARYENEPLNFPQAGRGEVVGIVHAPYNCNVGGKQYDVGIAVGGNFPLAVKRTGSLSFTKASGAMTIPAATVNKMLDDGINSVQGRVDELHLIIEGGTDANPNVLPAGTEIPRTTLQRNTPIIVSLPTTGSIQAGPYKPAAGATTMVIGMGSAAATFQFNGGGQSVKATCPKPEPDALLVDAPIL